MTEVDFAKAFIAQLSSRPIRIPADYVEDARKLPARPPTTLPKLPRSMTKRPKFSTSTTDSTTTTTSTSSTPSATLHLKTLRPPHSINETHVLPLNTTFAYVKQQLSSNTSVPFDKLRFLQKGKIVSDSKTLGDLVKEGEEEVLVNVMLMGGAVVVPKKQEEEVVKEDVVKEDVVKEEGKEDVEMKDEQQQPQQEEVVKKEEGGEEEVKGEKVLDHEEFWSGLKQYIVEKVGDEGADNVLGVFRSAWESKKSAP